MTIPVIPRETEGLDYYRPIFELNPQPMWICDRRVSRFLAVNETAVIQYGYSHREFQSMKVEALFAPESIEEFLNYRQGIHGPPAGKESRVWRHRTKSGRTFHAEVKIGSIAFDGCDAFQVVIQDVTARMQEAEALRSFLRVLQPFGQGRQYRLADREIAGASDRHDALTGL